MAVDHPKTIFGRDMMLPNPEKVTSKHIDNCRINYQVQGSAADLCKRAIIYTWDNGLADSLRLQVHDEMVYDGDIVFPDKELEYIYPDIKTPWDVKKGPKWVK